MAASVNTTKKPNPLLNFRHDPDIKKFVDDYAAEENIKPAAMYRKIFNTGFEALFKLKIRNNKIVQPPR